MMRKLLFTVFVLGLLFGGYLMYANQDTGLIEVRFAQQNYSMSLLKLGAISFVVAVFVLAISSIYLQFIKYIAQFSQKRKRRLAEKARQSLEKGLVELAEGRFDNAEKLLMQSISHSETALLCYLAAARAAQKQGKHAQRDDYLRKAHATYPAADIAISLTQAEQQLSHSQFEQALATLTKLHTVSPHHEYIFKLLATAYKKVGDWENLKILLPDLEKKKIFSQEDLSALRISVFKGLCDDLAEQKSLTKLTSLWDETPKHIRHMPDVLEHYSRKLIELGASGKAEHLLMQHLSHSWDKSIIILYSELNVLGDNNQLDKAEAWLNEHPHDEHLLFTLGKMCTLRSLWGKAKNYLEASLSIRPMPQTYLLLATLLEEHMGDEKQAAIYYKQGLLLFSDECINDVRSMPKDNITPDAVAPELKVI